jgi:histidinol-phosphate aminotransferase
MAKAYEPGASLKLGINEKLKYICLDGNEFPYNPSPKVLKALSDIINNGLINKYPDITNKELTKSIAEYVGVPKEYITVTNGADSAIKYLCNAFYNEDNRYEAMQEKITYGFFSKIANALCLPVHNSNKNIFSNLLYSFSEKKINYIVNPSNPGGVLYDKEELISLIREYKSRYYLIDEAYTEFNKDVSIASLVPYFNNLFVVRTFSKAFGLAGTRVGYIVANPDFIKSWVLPLKDFKEISLLSQVAAKTALEDMTYMEDRVEKIIEDRNKLVEELRKKNFYVINSNSNFIIIKNKEVKEIHKYLTNNGILVRIFDNWQGYMRISIGTTKEVDTLIKILGGY